MAIKKQLEMLCTILRNEHIRLPREPRSGDKSVEDNYLQHFQAFEQEITTATSSCDWPREIAINLNTVNLIGRTIREIFIDYFSGKLQVASEKFRDLIELNLDVKKAVEKLTNFAFLDRNAQVEESDIRRLLYRCRESDTPVYLQRKDLFHLPFEKRGEVSKQRYSLPGLPCLYLGGSILTCWIELGEPALHKLAMCRLEVSENVKIYDVGFTTEMII